MTDLSNNGSGDKGAKPKSARKTANRTSTAKKATMADETKTTSTEGGASGSLAEENSRLRATLQQIETRAEELRRWGMARQEMAREVVEERPLAVVGTAFAVGLLLGLIASRV